jgi:hypothetical protein
MRSASAHKVFQCLLAICVGLVGVVAFVQAPAGASSRVLERNARLVGTYDIFTSHSPSETLTLNPDGSFSRSNGDGGSWVAWKGNVVLNFHVSTVGNLGCIYLGTVEATGISSRDDPGPTNCHETRATWYAVKTTVAVISRPGPTGTAKGKRMSGRAPFLTTKRSRRPLHRGPWRLKLEIPRPGEGEQPRVVGTYDESNTAGVATATLTIKAAGFDNLISPSEVDIGYWVEHNGAVAFAVVDSGTGSLAGCIFVGMATTQGISPGLLDCNGHRFSWHATRVTNRAIVPRSVNGVTGDS